MAILVVVATLVGCGNNENATIVNEAGNEATTEEAAEETIVEVIASDYVTLSDYSAITVNVDKQEVTDEVIDEKVNAILQRNFSYEVITDRPAESGDLVEITYVGTADGEEFDSGTIGADGSDFMLGSGATIDGFEDAIIGLSVGEQKIAEVPFPEDYGNTELAGKDAEFDITLVAIKKIVYPEELTEEMITAANPECTTEEELREAFRVEMEEIYENQYNENVQHAALDVVTAEATFADELPQSIIDNYSVMIYSQLDQTAMLYGMDMTTLLESFYGQTLEEFDVVVMEQATQSTKMELVMKAIIEEKDIQVTDEEVNAYAESELESSGYETVEDFISMVGFDNFKLFLQEEKVLDLLVENTTVEPVEVVAE